jgi:hypothetical protein
MTEKARKEKVCLEEQCTEQWEAMAPELKERCGSFVYCPFCAGEMVIRCSDCGETIHDSSFQFCPWCGTGFKE